MAARIEVQRLSGRLEMCDVEAAEGKYMIAAIGDDYMICNQRFGAWFEMSYGSVLGRLNVVDELLTAAKRVKSK